MYYYAQVENQYINYLFRKDNSFERLQNTVKLMDTIIYDDKQIDILRKLHPDLITFNYGRVSAEYWQVRKINNLKKEQKIEHLNNIINHLKN